MKQTLTVLINDRTFNPQDQEDRDRREAFPGPQVIPSLMRAADNPHWMQNE